MAEKVAKLGIKRDDEPSALWPSLDDATFG